MIAFPQPLGGLGVAAGTEDALDQGLCLQGVGGGLGCDRQL